MASRRIFARGLTLITVIGLLAMASASSALAAPGNSGGLSKQDRERLATATANGASTVTMLFATIESSTGSVAAALSALGATVRKTDADVGYIRADVPTNSADAAAKLPGVQGSELDQTFDLTPPGAGEGDVPAQLPPDNTTPAQNAYMPTRDVGSPQFVAAHP